MSRNWEDCHPATSMRVKAVIAAMAAYGYFVFATETYRPLKRQTDLYAQGRTKPGKIVTWTKRGWHNLKKGGKPSAQAVDVAFRTQDRFPGRDPWDKRWPWKRLRKIAEACDLKITVPRDKGHLVDTQGKSFRDTWNASDKD